MFVDWNMPNMDGEEFVSRVREETKYDKIKIIMSTTENTKEKVSGILKKGINGYLVKPFDPSKIATVIKQLVARL
jgi:two-component system chemotaxis response regulator CheY